MDNREKLPYQPRRFCKPGPCPGAARYLRGRLTWLPLAILLAVAPASYAEEVRLSLDGPDVTIIASAERTVYEFRQNGQLRMVRVVPKWGKPYYLVPADPTKGYGDLERADMLLPSWVIAEF